MQPNMKMLQQMQNRMAKIQAELAATEITGTAGGGAVTAKVSGQKEFIGISIDKDFVDPEDVEMLEETITAAIKNAMDQAQHLAEEKMAVLTGGMKIPGLF
jgi:DNA-binding YbaB/EbfC family protein